MALDSFKQVTVRGDALTARVYHASIVYNGRLYVLMGVTTGGSTRLGDVMSTKDGRVWSQRTAIVDNKGATITARNSFGVCEHAGKVYLFGGFDGSNYLNDVYVSDNMVRWTKLNSAGWTGRYAFAHFSYDGRLWVIGGISNSGAKNSVWWTRNGVQWTQETNAPWAARHSMGYVQTNDRMYIIGGTNGSAYYNDVWYTQDGRNWVRMESNANFSGRSLIDVCTFGKDGRIIMVGGQTGASTRSDDLWHSGEGNNWYLGDDAMPCGTRRGATLDYFDGRLFLVGGVQDASTYQNDVWESHGELFKAK